MCGCSRRCTANACTNSGCWSRHSAERVHRRSSRRSPTPDTNCWACERGRCSIRCHDDSLAEDEPLSEHHSRYADSAARTAAKTLGSDRIRTLPFEPADICARSDTALLRTRIPGRLPKGTAATCRVSRSCAEMQSCETSAVGQASARRASSTRSPLRIRVEPFSQRIITPTLNAVASAGLGEKAANKWLGPRCNGSKRELSPSRAVDRRCTIPACADTTSRRTTSSASSCHCETPFGRPGPVGDPIRNIVMADPSNDSARSQKRSRSESTASATTSERSDSISFRSRYPSDRHRFTGGQHRAAADEVPDHRSGRSISSVASEIEHCPAGSHTDQDSLADDLTASPAMNATIAVSRSRLPAVCRMAAWCAGPGRLEGGHFSASDDLGWFRGCTSGDRSLARRVRDVAPESTARRVVDCFSDAIGLVQCEPRSAALWASTRGRRVAPRLRPGRHPASQRTSRPTRWRRHRIGSAGSGGRDRRVDGGPVSQSMVDLRSISLRRRLRSRCRAATVLLHERGRSTPTMQAARRRSRRSGVSEFGLSDQLDPARLDAQIDQTGRRSPASRAAARRSRDPVGSRAIAIEREEFVERLGRVASRATMHPCSYGDIVLVAAVGRPQANERQTPVSVGAVRRPISQLRSSSHVGR